MSLDFLLSKFLKDKQTMAIICNQWGDTGKGKFSEFFALNWADVTARGTGGNNAGHTVVIDGREIIFHLLPTGILYDGLGKINILGNGMVIDLKALGNELDEIKMLGGSYNNLRISKDAYVIMPYHVAQDRAKNQSQADGGIGSTGRGIGPCYADKIARRGITIGDLFDTDVLARKIRKASAFYPEQKLEVDAVIQELRPYADRIKSLVTDTVRELHELLGQGKKVLLEGAQGLLLSIEYGTYPYVTSSDCSLNGTAAGVGISAKDIDVPLGIVKFPFMTRVGAGPFPTELGGNDSEKYCASGLDCDVFYEVKTYLGMNLDLSEIRELQKQNKTEELLGYKQQVKDYIKTHSDDVTKLINSSDPFTKGIGMRLAAFEYGATTGRPRRIGWTDAVAAKYAVMINGPLVILTKPDSLSGCKEFSIGYGYQEGAVIHKDFNKDCSFLKRVVPELRSYDGYPDIKGIRTYDVLGRVAPGLVRAIEDFEAFTRARVMMVSTGPERDQTILNLH